MSLYLEVVFLKWNKSQLVRLSIPSFTYEESVKLDSDFIQRVPNLLDVKNIEVKGRGHYYDETENLHLQVSVKGVMVVPCARSLEPVDYVFETEGEIDYCFSEQLSDEWIVVKNNTIDTKEFIEELVMLEVPMRVVKEGSTLNRSGKGWEVKSENEVGIDPRLEKLKDFFKE